MRIVLEDQNRVEVLEFSIAPFGTTDSVDIRMPGSKQGVTVKLTILKHLIETLEKVSDIDYDNY